MNRKRLTLALTIFVSILFSITYSHFSNVNAAETQPITLRFASYQPPRGIEGEAPKWLMREITKRTQGKVIFQEYFGGSLLTAREVLKGIQLGTADMGFIFTAYYPRELRIHALPQAFIRGPVKPRNKIAFFESFYREIPEAKKEIETLNQKLLAIHLFGQMSVGAVVPIKELGDVKGLKLRVAGGTDALHMKCAGANVVFLPSSDVYSALQKGSVEGAYSTPSSFYRGKWYETAKPFYLLVMPSFSGTYAFISINQDKFNSLPKDIQEVIVNVGKEYNLYEADLLDRSEQEYMKEMASLGVQISHASSESIIQFAESCEKEAKAKSVEEAEKLGIPGSEIMQRLTKLISKYYEK